MSNHSVIEHRANYHFIKVEEDYVHICSNSGQYPQCKAVILSILEHWINDKRSKGLDEYVYMTYPEWIDNMYGLFRRSTIIACLTDLEHEGLISRRPCKRHGKDTYEYTLNVASVQEKLKQLPERTDKYTRPNLNASKFKRVQKQTRSKVDDDTDTNLDGSEHGDASKNERNIDTITYTPSNIESDSCDTSSEDRNAPAPINFVERKSDKYKAITKEEIASHSQQAIRNDEEEDISLAETTKHKAMPKQTPGAGSPPAATPPGGSTAASVQASRSGPPVDAAQRTASSPGTPSGAVQASIPKRPRGKKPPVLPDEQPQPKCDTREIQRRVNEHRGYALEEKVDIVRERQAIKTWCNLHTLEEYGLVMAGAKNDKYWGKQENYYRIGGLTLLKITPEILARQRQPLQLVSNGHNGHRDMVEWQGQWMTVEQADELGYNGGFGLYK